MTTALVTFTPWTVLIDYDGKQYFSSKDIDSVRHILETSEWLTFDDGQRIKSTSVKRYYEDKSGVAGLTPKQRSWLHQRKKEFKQNLGRKPNEVSIAKMIARMHRDNLA